MTATAPPPEVQRPALDIVEPDSLPTTANVLLYGPPKVGKSTAAAGAPKPLYLNCDLPNALRYPRTVNPDLDEIRPTGLQTLIDVTNNLKAALEAGDCPWQTLVCDPMSELYRILITDLSGGGLHVPLPIHNNAQTYIERFCREFCELPINTVWVAHETSQKDEVAGHFERIPAMGTTNPNPAGKLMAMVDVIGYCGVVDREGQPPSYQAQLVSANGRRGGDRFNVLGKTRPLALGEWFAVMAATNQPKGAHK